MAPRLNTTRARQGRSGKPILWVLGISTVAAAAVLFGAWAFKAPDLATTSAKPTPETAATFNTPEPTPRQNESTPPPAR
jgi:hypothetical protein